MKIAIIYGSTTGNTCEAAEAIERELEDVVEACLDVDTIELDKLKEYDVVLVGVPTWDVGNIQESWDAKLGSAGDLDLTGLRIALFGHGDQEGYPFSFQDALGLVRNDMLERGAIADIGWWPNEGYDYDDSLALIEDGKYFVGLALDEHNQDEMTEERIKAWCVQLRKELGLTHKESA
ncbi:MAG: flavodoxin [Myxococcota bacterium]